MFCLLRTTKHLLLPIRSSRPIHLAQHVQIFLFHRIGRRYPKWQQTHRKRKPSMFYTIGIVGFNIVNASQISCFFAAISIRKACIWEVPVNWDEPKWCHRIYILHSSTTLGAKLPWWIFRASSGRDIAESILRSRRSQYCQCTTPPKAPDHPGGFDVQHHSVA